MSKCNTVLKIYAGKTYTPSEGETLFKLNVFILLG